MEHQPRTAEKTAETKREWTTPRLRAEAKVVDVTLTLPLSGRD